MSLTRPVLFSLMVSLFASRAFAAPEMPGLPEVRTYDQLVSAIRETRSASRARIEAAVEEEKVREAWETGRLIDKHILLHKERAEYGTQVLKRLAKDLGTSQTELSFMLQFARAYPIYSPANQLSWSHYRELLSLNDSKERDEVTKEAEEKGWSRDQVREEVRRRQRRTQVSVKLPEITPGPLNTYQIIRLKDRLKIDLGFGVYRNLPEKYAKKFKEGDIVRVDPSLRDSKPSDAEATPPPIFGPKGQSASGGYIGGGAISLLKDASPSNLYTYQAQATQVVDGDTFHALIDLGFETTLAQRVRLRRIDAPEILTADGKEAKAYLEKILSRDNGRILMKSVDIDQHGRPIADVWVKGKSIDQELLEEGLAVRISD